MPRSQKWNFIFTNDLRIKGDWHRTITIDSRPFSVFPCKMDSEWFQQRLDVLGYGTWRWTSMGFQESDFSESTKAELSDGNKSWKWEIFCVDTIARVDSMCLHSKMRVESTFLYVSEALREFTLIGAGRPRHQRCNWDSPTGWISTKKSHIKQPHCDSWCWQGLHRCGNLCTVPCGGNRMFPLFLPILISHGLLIAKLSGAKGTPLGWTGRFAIPTTASLPTLRQFPPFGIWKGVQGNRALQVIF